MATNSDVTCLKYDAEGPGFACMPSVTFALTGEDYTLGNVLRALLAANSEVEFVGCSIPHPTQPEMNLRVQTHGAPAVQLFEKSLNDLIAVCDHLTETYDKAVQEFSSQKTV